MLNKIQFDDLVAPVVVLELIFKGHTQIPMIETIDESLLVHFEELAGCSRIDVIPLLLEYSLKVGIFLVCYQIGESFDASFISFADLLVVGLDSLSEVILEKGSEAGAYLVEATVDAFIFLILSG